MQHMLFPQLGLPPQLSSSIRLGGQRYRLTGAGYDALRLLALLHADSQRADSRLWALKHRRAIRDIRPRQVRAALTFVILNSQLPRVRLLAVWLRGQCGGYVGTQAIARFSKENADSACQRHSAKALRDLGALSQLRELAQRSPLAKSRPLLFRPKTRQAMQERLSSFLANISQQPTATGAAGGSQDREQASLFLSSAAEEQLGKPAKPLWLIRLVLDRVRLLVSNERSQDRLPRQLY